MKENAYEIKKKWKLLMKNENERKKIYYRIIEVKLKKIQRNKKATR